MSPLLKFSKLIPLSLLAFSHAKDDEGNDGDGYYDTCTNPKTSPKNLTPNTFHKICPETTNKSLGQPICGDGTDFSFLYTSPTQRKANEEKIVIEFQGGGACWSDDTCGNAGDRLTYPESLDNFLGYSCSAAAYGTDNYDGYPINLLCNAKIGDTDFSNYHYILVPYCTQDVHIGDNIAEYEDGESVYHHGGHNMMAVLRWVYDHFSNPSHIFLTGCSAGGSALPVAYDLLYHHYNSFLKGGRSVNINTIMDSAVYLTPKYFLNNGMTNWNINTILEKTKFDPEYEQSVLYSTYLWKHVLKRGANKDKWGFLSHTNDPVSMKYWQAMGAGYYDDDNQNAEDCDSWYSDMSQSLALVQESHKNADVFNIDGQGHCSLGLYYGLQEDGFDSWAGEIVKEQTILKRSNESIHWFIISVSVGALLMTSALSWKSKSNNDKNEVLLSSNEEPKIQNIVLQRINNALAPLIPIGKRFESCPVTTFYFTVTSLYFIYMLIDGGFTHPLNNPSLGPSATTLSKFGINNPTLIVDKKQVMRLLSSGFVCSGVLTYLLVAVCVFKCMRHTERVSKNTGTFALTSACIMLGSNLFYACVGNGASCGSLGFVLGMNYFSIGLSKKLGPEAGLQSPKCSTIFYTLLAIFLFPFNSWILILSAMIIGSALPFFLIKESNADPTINEWMPKPAELSKIVHIFSGAFALLFVLILAGVPNPNEKYQYPYYTGCRMMYSTDIGSIVASFGGRRLENGFDYDNGGCAQFCVPHLVERPFYFSLKKYAAYSENDYAVNYGACDDIGYDAYIADTTFQYMNYPLDVEVYDVGDDDGGN